MPDLKALIAKLGSGRTLSRDESRRAFDIMMSGDATPSQIGGFLMALRVRGETVDEIAGAVSSMRSRMTPVVAPEGAVDIVGTGGDASGTYNISTCSAFVLAGAGVPVAKHGNRALSSRSGAADVLTALGVKVDIPPETISRCINEAGIGFMFAPNHHAAMRHVGPSRVELGTRTIFNLLGPLCNPANVKRYMFGVFSREWIEPLAKVLQAVGAESAWVVHGAFGETGGIDEISTTGTSYVAELKDGAIRTFEIHPTDVGIAVAQPRELVGGDAEHNARALRAVLDGEPGAYRDVVTMNAGAALMVAGRVELLAEGVAKARESIDTGRAKAAYERLVAVSNG
ncbi:anthranilate phosphoribosyltransferase [Faunimonas pinastri]|uniref:anthranilate phosphoribosyltransferase n=1 Tax=Faunimonas pinastri TaxID=1855383 RepID=UPI000B821BCD|nr:anthranilate phosphoribosyltransferase [Faunimonas pinastri]